MSSVIEQTDIGVEKIVEAGRTCANAFSLKQSKPFARDQDRIDFEDQLGRFKLLAGNVGIFAAGTASTDYRLRDDQHLRDALISILKRLAIEVESLKSSSSGQHEAPEQISTSTSSSSSTSSLLLSSDIESEHELGDVPIDEGDRSVLGIKNIIDRLYRLSVVIRKPTPLSENVRISQFAQKHKDTLGLQDCQSYFKWQIQRMCPDTTVELVDRLLNAVIRRRERLCYREKHQQKLNQGVEDWLTRRDAAQTRESTTTKKRIVQFKEHDSGVIEVQHSKLATRTRLSETKATTVDAKPTLSSYERSVAPSGITKSAIARRSHLDVPPPPKAKNGQEVQCPYCPRLLGAVELKQERWM